MPTQIQIRPWRAGDEVLLAQAELSPAGLSRRFLAGMQSLPPAYLRYVAKAPRDRWDAQVAVAGGRLLGWAEFGRQSGQRDQADIAVMVVDGWQRRGVATALFRAMLPRATAVGVRVVHADVAPANTAARAMVTALFGGRIQGAIEDGLLHYRMAI